MDAVDAGQKEPACKVQVQVQGKQEVSALFLLREWKPGIAEIPPHSHFENPSQDFIQESLLRSNCSEEICLGL